MEDLLASLKSSDVQRRRLAIIALGKTKNPAALKALGEVYKTDPDPDLRQLALEAGKYIRQHASQAAPPPPPSQSRPPSQPSAFYTQDEPAESVYSSSSDLGYEIVEPKTPNPKYASTINLGGEVDEREVARAKAYLDRAMSLHMSKNPGKAAEALIKAVEINPAIKRDAVAQGLAAAITGQAPERAFEFLGNVEVRQEFIKVKQKETRSERSEGTFTENLMAVGLDLATMTLVMTIGVVIVFVLFVRALNDNGNVFEWDPNSSDSVWNTSTGGYSDFETDFYNEMCADYFNNPQLQASDPNGFCTDYVNQQRVNQAVSSAYADTFNIEEIQTVGVGIAVVIGLVLGVISAVSLIIQNTCIHYVATILGGGVGSLAGLMKRMIPYQTIVMAVLFAGFGIMLFDGTPSTIGLVYIILIALGLINIFTPVYLTMKSYRFGFVNGCGSYCGGAIVAGLITSFCQTAFFTILGQLIGTAA